MDFAPPWNEKDRIARALFGDSVGDNGSGAASVETRADDESDPTPAGFRAACVAWGAEQRTRHRYPARSWATMHALKTRHRGVSIGRLAALPDGNGSAADRDDPADLSDAPTDEAPACPHVGCRESLRQTADGYRCPEHGELAAYLVSERD
jgi:hypothetical protein